MAFFQRIMDIPQFAISGLESPLLVGIEVSQSDVVDDDVFYERIPVIVLNDTYRCISAC